VQGDALKYQVRLNYVCDMSEILKFE
jgi:hypothetical protein